MIGSRLIKSNDVAAGCEDIVDAYDPFGDSSGLALYQLNGNANDESGNYNGTASNITYSTGVFGQAGVFNGSNTYFSSPYNVGGDLTISCWVKFDTINTEEPIVCLDNIGAGSRALQLKRTPSNKLYAFIFTGSDITGTTNLTSGVWYHIALTFQSNVALRIYINGEFEGQSTNVTTRPTQPNFFFGKFGDGSLTSVLDGDIDQVRIFNTALDPLEVEALYTEELCICDGTVDTLDILGDGSCIATYQLDGNANDLSGNYSGTPTDVSYGVGEFDLAGVFNGSSSYIDLPPSVISTNNFSISFWFKTSSIPADVRFLFANEATSANRGIQMLFENSKIGFNCANGTNKVIVWNTVPSVDTWYNVVGTLGSTSGANLYINGSSVGTNTYTILDIANHTECQIGGRGWNSSLFFNGSIDQFRIFNKALSAGEVTTLYNETACTKETREAGVTQILGDNSCVAYYKLDGTAIDETGNHDGTFTNPNYGNGEFDFAGVFNTGKYIDLGNSFALFNSTQNLSVSLWFKTTSSGRLFGSEYSVSYFPIEIHCEVNGTVYLAIRNSGGTPKITSSLTFNNNSWHHLVGVVNVSSNLVSLYVNNTLIGTTNVGGSGSSTQKRFIGGEGGFYNGSIDQVRIFNKAVSASEVTTLYNEGL